MAECGAGIHFPRVMTCLEHNAACFLLLLLAQALLAPEISDKGKKKGGIMGPVLISQPDDKGQFALGNAVMTP